VAGQRSLEEQMLDRYVEAAAVEREFDEWRRGWSGGELGVVVGEGFEERSVGLLRRLASSGVRVSFVGVARYRSTADLNRAYRAEFEALAAQLSGARARVLWNDNDGRWIDEAVKESPTGKMLLDISGLSTTSMFCALDYCRARGIELLIGYSEARSYRPTLEEWRAILDETEGDVDAESRLAERVDEAQWLYGGAHTVALVADHEGYDSGAESALLAFLPFKPARLVALLGEQQYCEQVYVAGKPRLLENEWRLGALERMNARFTRNARVVAMDTFGYRSCVSGLRNLLCGTEGLLSRYDVQVAPFGSKLQNVGVWIVSTLIPALTVISAHPETFHPEAFSEGVGESWVFPLTMPVRER